MELQIALNTVASDIFRKQADCDYVAARSNFKLQLRQQFLWSAQQAIEKYLKAILLFNGRSARYKSDGKTEFGHNLCALMDEVKKIEIFSFELDPFQDQFIEYLAKQGTNRYIVTTAYNSGDELEDLDSTVWHIRRYCQYMADRGIGCKEHVPGMREAVVAAALNPSHKLNPQKFTLFAGQLEKILKRAKTDPARKALVWANLFYGARKRKAVIYRTFSSTEIPPCERNWPSVDWNEIKKYVKL